LFENDLNNRLKIRLVVLSGFFIHLQKQNNMKKIIVIAVALLTMSVGCTQKPKYREFTCYRVDPASLICKYRARAQNSNDEIIILDECGKYRVGQVIAKQLID